MVILETVFFFNLYSPFSCSTIGVNPLILYGTVFYKLVRVSAKSARKDVLQTVKTEGILKELCLKNGTHLPIDAKRKRAHEKLKPPKTRYSVEHISTSLKYVNKAI